MEKKLYELDWRQCPYCEDSYYEYDTGYAEYDCGLLNQLCGGSYSCKGGYEQSQCPLICEYSVE